MSELTAYVIPKLARPKETEMRTRLRQLWCAINGHPSRETINTWDELRGVTWRIRRQTCLGCGKKLA